MAIPGDEATKNTELSKMQTRIETRIIKLINETYFNLLKGKGLKDKSIPDFAANAAKKMLQDSIGFADFVKQSITGSMTDAEIAKIHEDFSDIASWDDVSKKLGIPDAVQIQSSAESAKPVNNNEFDEIYDFLAKAFPGNNVNQNGNIITITKGSYTATVTNTASGPVVSSNNSPELLAETAKRLIDSGKITAPVLSGRNPKSIMDTYTSLRKVGIENVTIDKQTLDLLRAAGEENNLFKVFIDNYDKGIFENIAMENPNENTPMVESSVVREPSDDEAYSLPEELRGEEASFSPADDEDDLEESSIPDTPRNNETVEENKQKKVGLGPLDVLNRKKPVAAATGDKIFSVGAQEAFTKDAASLSDLSLETKLQGLSEEIEECSKLVIESDSESEELESRLYELSEKISEVTSEINASKHNEKFIPEFLDLQDNFNKLEDSYDALSASVDSEQEVTEDLDHSSPKEDSTDITKPDRPKL